MSDDGDERAAERVGSVLNDKWTLERLIGIGGMAAVYAGVHRNGARAAIKILHPSYARRPEVRERFLREGYAANRVNHSGVVKVLDDDVIEGGPDADGAFLVMELLEGHSIEDRLERGPPISERELLAIARAVLDVLDAAHKAGVIHRDLKPENLFLTSDPEKAKLKILDFGLARIAEGSNKTMAGVAIGTPSYMPPEQAAGRVFEVDARSDLFALGATCFRILANRTVHPAESALAICARMAKEPAPKLRSVAPNVSEATARVIDRALEFKRDDRWPDAASMRAAVNDAIETLGGETIEIDSGMLELGEVTEPKKRAAPPVAPPPEPVEHVEPKKTSASFFLWLAIIVLTAVAAKLVYQAFGPQPPAPVGSADAQSATQTPPIASSNATVETPLVDATLVDAPTDVAALDAAVDAEPADAESTDATTDASIAPLSDADVTDGRAFTLTIPDAGAHVAPQRHDAGTHHVPPHRPHHR